MRVILWCNLVLWAFLLQSCNNEEKFSTSPLQLSFSVDTIKFDTVFTTIGSSTQLFKIYNHNKESVKTSVSLESSYYRLNIDGVATNKLRNLEIRAHDSTFVFVEVTIDPQDSNTPVLVLDSVVFNTNGNVQNVKLQAYGQDVVIINDSIIRTDAHWTNEKPYLVYNSVLVDTLQTLQIDEGTQIYFHENSSLLVKGRLFVNGTKDQPVTFLGDRLEAYYKNKQGQWGASYIVDDQMHYFGNIHILDGSYGNVINYAIVKNGTKGIQVDNHNQDNLTLTLSNTIIENMSISGIYAQNANLLVYNTVVSNCGYYTVAMSMGGNYEFIHTSLINAKGHALPSVIFNNFQIKNNSIVEYDFKAKFINSIIWGSLPNEIIIDQSKQKAALFEYKFENCLLKVDRWYDISDTLIFSNILVANSDIKPRFKNIDESNFRLDTLSSAKDAGTAKYLNRYPLDLDEVQRDSMPDLGAYERIEL